MGKFKYRDPYHLHNYNVHRVSVRLRSQIITKWREGYDKYWIAFHYNVHYKTVERYVSRWLDTGTVLSGFELYKAKKAGKVEYDKLVEHETIADALTDHCILYPSTTLASYQVYIWGEFGIYASKTTISRFFRRRKFNYKRYRPLAKEACDTEQHLFWIYLSSIVTDIGQLVFMDESYRSDRTTNKHYARGPGPVFCKCSFTRGNYKYSLILAAACCGVLAYDVYFGSINEDYFNDFIIKDLLQKLNPYPGRFSVLLLDNVRFHHNALFMQVMAEHGILVIFLPHYSPLYNLAEICFRDIKSIERMKGIRGEKAGLLSMHESVASIASKNYKSTLRDLGYIV